ncbi:MAG: endo-1,4-beta-xylanase [Candidatus Marinimicrobia bacterium]|jgi:endo-1,4-beta-xylanase|nr:endo-1,4-beta-xylanase [Candidatus Neomarinimicrobiota bacterium]
MFNESKKSGVSQIFITILVLALATLNLNAQLVTNGGFESSELGVVTGTDVEGWLIQISAGSAVFEIVDDTVQSGNRALKATVDTLGSNQWDIQIVGDSIPAVPGAKYRYSVWARAQKAGAQTNFTVGNYAYTEYKAIRPANLTTDWKLFSTEFIVNDQETVIRAPIHFNYSGNVGNAVFIDNLRIVNVEEIKKPVIVEAESGELGSEFDTLTTGDITYITPKTTWGTGNPATPSRINTYQVTFPDSGTYDLFVKLRVGSDGFNDDSFFYGNGFGIKDSVSDDDWIMVNGMASAGFKDSSDVVSAAGALGTGVWKWVNLSKNGFQQGENTAFYVHVDSLTQVLQIGGREDGLDIDKFAFGRADLNYTVSNLEKREAGSPPVLIPIYEGPPLATGKPKFLGCAYSTAQAENFESYWNKVTPENAGKWGSVEGTRDVMNWGALDAAYNLAKDNGFAFHFHVLIWGAQQPSWIDTLSDEDKLAEITEWFQAVADRYPDIEYLEVVNEPLPNHNPPDGQSGRANYKSALGGNGSTGWDWVINAFSMARDIFPDSTKLLINDFGIVNSISNVTEYLKIINLLKADTLIDGIGVQGHAFNTIFDASIMKANLDSLATAGLPIYVTELDIDGPSDNEQLNEYKRIFPTFWNHPAVEGITLWGWRPGLWRNDQKAYIINSDNTERPALVWLREYVPASLSIHKPIAETPQSFKLFGNYPNPFNPTTTINYQLPVPSYLTIKVFDLLGREVVTLVEGVRSAGSHSVTFDGSGLAGGVYLYQLKTSDFTETKKCLFLK